MTITVLESAREIAAAQGELEQSLKRQSDYDGELLLGFQGGANPAIVYSLKDVDLWVGFKRAPGRYWNAFGRGNPFKQRQPISITVEINPPYSGIKRRVQGAFGHTPSGEHLLLHRGGVGGGKKGVGKTEFLNYYSGIGIAKEAIDGDRTADVIVVGVLGDSTLAAQVKTFVDSVADFKTRVGSGTQRHEKSSSTFRPEFVGVKVLPPRESIVAEVQHGAIVNQLTDRLIDHGLNPVSDGRRDLFILMPHGHKIVFEVKTSCDRYSIYTAVGQLFVNEPGSNVTRIPVLPADLPKSLRKSLAELSLTPLFFRWKGAQVVFLRLDRLLKNLNNSRIAPAAPY
jgi:hypothetical protein